MIKLYSAKITDFTQADYARQYSLLDVALRQKIDNKNNDAKKCSLAGYILLYQGAFELFGKTDINISFNQNGKPMCDFCCFSISHSEDRVVCAISDKPVGIDIQKIKDIKFRPEYKLFTSCESDYVNEKTDLLSIRFTEIFTKKESAVKLLGLSLSQARLIDTLSNKFIFKKQRDGDFIITVCTKAEI